MKDERKHEQARDDRLAESFHQLSESICGLAGVMLQLTNEISHNDNNQAVLHRLVEMENRIMSAISLFAERVDTKFTTISNSVDAIVVSQTGVTGDIKGLKDLILQLQNSPGTVTPEDQALLDALEAKINTTSDKVAATATALAALDAETDPVTVPTPTP